MNLKTILALCAMASMATAAPAGDLEKRDCPAGKKRFCCDTFFPVNILFVRAVGTNCALQQSIIGNCPSGQVQGCCASNLPLSGGSLACTAL
ncbi:hypothetical protein BDV32DRAFT_144877 [Aspergillus pseudonomiae]|uniref:Uncharacterized protein n=1 Tax=Aspergillus pseudonomiae TaxID=1506151 RepID=A0A5N7DM25_9EURO|nr:uncharacterized protein BDV37DRAFT_280035 [Aspergillus pseudonomiae]KAB8264842.1 hypothetical protein BDV32DRAFT_144877 [Aspergillus pseudonomiae]KAE8407502.1 hypothetical protein BDV37DRAFT_280035 [Aspergillus pseudonomiae]